MRTISRWERGEDTIEANAEVLVRVCATQEPGLPCDSTVIEISGWCVGGEVAPPALIIDGSDPGDYRIVG